MIAILCPTRGRSEQCKRMLTSAAITATNHVIAYCGASDRTQTSNFGEFDWVKKLYFQFPDNLPTAQKWNLLAEKAMKNPDNKLFMLGADDMVFETPGWDVKLIEHYNALENKIHVYSLQDSRDENGTPHIICTREYI